MLVRQTVFVTKQTFKRKCPLCSRPMLFQRQDKERALTLLNSHEHKDQHNVLNTQNQLVKLWEGLKETRNSPERRKGGFLQKTIRYNQQKHRFYNIMSFLIFYKMRVKTKFQTEKYFRKKGLKSKGMEGNIENSIGYNYVPLYLFVGR